MKQGRIPDSLEDSTITYKWLLSNFDDGEKITDSEITILEFLKQRDSTNEAKNSGGKSLIDSGSLTKHINLEDSNFIDVSSDPQFKSIVWKYFKRNKLGNAKCNQCNKLFEIIRNGTSHLRDHLIKKHGIELEKNNKERYYKCDFCEKSFSQAINLRKHIRIHEKSDISKENEISDSLREKIEDLVTRIKSLKSIKKCKGCQISFQSILLHLNMERNKQCLEMYSEEDISILKNNSVKLTKAKDKLWVIRNNNKRRAQRLEKNKCFKLEHDVEFSQSTEKKKIALSTSQCEICGKSFKYLQNMKYHVNTAHESGNNVLICSACAKSYKTKALLRTHVRRVHEGLKSNGCGTCGKSFHKPSELKKHIQAVHEGKKEILCILCPKSFFDNHGLQKHLRIFHKDRNCEICSKTVHNYRDFKEHLKEHEKEIYCNSCGKSLSSTHMMKRHIHNVHEGHKDYQCDVCGKSFSDKTYLGSHKRTVHEGRKDFKCETCGKLFGKRQIMKNHTRAVHKGERDHNCETCGKLFFNIGDLKRHIDSVHLKKPDVWNRKKN